MRATRVVEHDEAGSWWAESPDVPGFTAVADDQAALRALVKEATQEWDYGPVVYVECPPGFMPTVDIGTGPL